MAAVVSLLMQFVILSCWFLVLVILFQHTEAGVHICEVFSFFQPWRICVLTAAVEACVLHGLKRRAAGFLRSNKIAALFMKVGKNFAPAEELCRKAQEVEQIIETK